MFLEVALQAVGRVAIIVNAAIGVEAYATQEPYILLGSNVAQSFRRLDSAVTVAQKTPDVDRIDVMAPTPLQKPRVVFQKYFRRTSVGVGSTNRLRARTVECPFRAVIPG